MKLKYCNRSIVSIIQSFRQQGFKSSAKYDSYWNLVLINEKLRIFHIPYSQIYFERELDSDLKLQSKLWTGSTSTK